MVEQYEVAELIPFGFQVFFVDFIGINLQGHPFDDFQPITMEADYLLWVVRHKAHPTNPEVPKDLGSDTVVP